MFQSITNPFRRFRNKLALSHILISMLTFLLLELFIGGVITFYLTHLQVPIFPDLQTQTALIFLGALLATLLAAILSAILGYWSAHGLTRRFNKLSAAASSWSPSNCSSPAEDTLHDELGLMVYQLNHMTEELQHLLQTRQQITTLEECHRLVRDLHDNVKQQVFAISMQLGAAKHLLKHDPEAAEEHLLKAEKLVQQAQRELAPLIREFRPVTRESRELTEA